MKTFLLFLTTLFTLTFIGGCSPKIQAPKTLKEAFKDHFLIGAAVNDEMLLSNKHPSFLLAQQQFNSLTTDNAFKWEQINPLPNEYRFEPTDAFVARNQVPQQHLVGHVLFWHSQTPDWVFEDESGALLSREALLDRMKERAQMLAKRYAKDIKIWDVVNEAITDSGELRDSKYHQIIGDDFIEQAFRIAEEAFPADCKLLYNDYGMTKPPRKTTVINMVTDLKAKNIKIDGIGMQGHWSMNTPTAHEIEQAIKDFSETQLPIHITELDIDYLGRDQYFGADINITKVAANEKNNPYPAGNFPKTADAQLSSRYQEIFSIFLKHSADIERVTFWGVTDADSWLNDWPIEGRTNYPLLFDRNLSAKPAYDAILKQGFSATKTTLKSAFEGKFLIGGALTNEILTNPKHTSLKIAKTHFNSITSGNALKWDHLNPEPGIYTPELADQFVAFGVKHDMDIVGHTLFWHQQTPKWVFEDDKGNDVSREILLDRMRQRVRYIANRYGDKIKIWDVVNEAIEEDGSLRKTKFLEIIGGDFIEQAFKIATEELPSSVKLIYNDYEMVNRRRYVSVIKMIYSIRNKGYRIDGAGMQGHYELSNPKRWRIRLALLVFQLSGIPVYITEFDMDFLGRNWFYNSSKEERERISKLPESNPFPNADFPEEADLKLSKSYKDIFSIYLDYSDTIERVTFWGVTDSDSWLNDWPVKGRTNYPFLFDRSNKPKPAFYEVLKQATDAR